MKVRYSALKSFAAGLIWLGLEPELLRQLARLERLQPGERIDRLAHDFLRRLLRDGLDFHAAFRARDDQRRRGRAIEQHGKIKFARDVGRLRDEHLVHEPPGRAGLVRDQRLAEHLAGDLARFRRRIAR